jgi:hypothetical protein
VKESIPSLQTDIVLSGISAVAHTPAGMGLVDSIDNKFPPKTSSAQDVLVTVAAALPSLQTMTWYLTGTKQASCYGFCGGKYSRSEHADPSEVVHTTSTSISHGSYGGVGVGVG